MNEANERDPQSQGSKAERPASRRAAVQYPDIMDRLEELGLLDDLEFATDALNAFALDGVETVGKLRGAISNRDTLACEQLAHRIKGAALNIGAAKLGELARLLEEMGRLGDLTEAAPRLEELETEFKQVHAFAAQFSGRSEAA